MDPQIAEIEWLRAKITEAAFLDQMARGLDNIPDPIFQNAAADCRAMAERLRK